MEAFSLIVKTSLMVRSKPLVIITLVRCARARVTCVTEAGRAWCPASRSACSASRYHCSSVSTHARPPPCDSDPAPPREHATDTQTTLLEHFVIQFEVEELFFRRFSFVHMNEWNCTMQWSETGYKQWPLHPDENVTYLSQFNPFCGWLGGTN